MGMKWLSEILKSGNFNHSSFDVKETFIIFYLINYTKTNNMKRRFFLLPGFFLSAIILLTSCNNYGDKANNGHVDVYYKDGIKKEQAQKAADLLYEIDKTYNNNTSEIKSFQVATQNDTVVFRMVVEEEKLKNIDDESFYAIGNMISENVFDNAPVNVDLTDNKFNTIRSLHFKKMDMTEDEEETKIDPVEGNTVEKIDSISGH
jgi:hypothetical protein